MRLIFQSRSLFLVFPPFLMRATPDTSTWSVIGIVDHLDQDDHQDVSGPDESPFEGGVFKLELFLPEDYPMSAPKVPGSEYINWLILLYS